MEFFQYLKMVNMGKSVANGFVILEFGIQRVYELIMK